MRKTVQPILFFLAVLWAGAAMAQDLIVFPARGQSQEQLEKDKLECYAWAKKQTGFDPMATPKTSSPPPQAQARQGEVVRGAGRGAALGAVVGGIAGDAGTGAAAGAAGGALVGGMRRRDQAAREAQAQQQLAARETAQYDSKRSAYNRAGTACLEGKGYTVK